MPHVVEGLLGDDIAMTTNVFKLLAVLIQTHVSSFYADICCGPTMKLVKAALTNKLCSCDPRSISRATKNIQVDKSATGQIKPFVCPTLFFK